MKPFARQREQRVDIAVEPIDHVKACILTNLWHNPGSRVVERNGVLFLRNGRFEIRCEYLCAAKAAR